MSSARNARSIANHRLRNALIAAGDHIERRPLAVRDHWRCGICCGRIETLDEATIDHIVPLSRGGQHVWSNVQIAHAACNARKGNAIDGEMWGQDSDDDHDDGPDGGEAA